MAEQLGRIVDYIDQLQAVEGASEPRAVSGLRDAEDTALPSLPREVFLALAPAVREGFLSVPEVKASEAEES